MSSPCLCISFPADRTFEAHNVLQEPVSGLLHASPAYMLSPPTLSPGNIQPLTGFSCTHYLSCASVVCLEYPLLSSPILSAQPMPSNMLKILSDFMTTPFFHLLKPKSLVMFFYSLSLFTPTGPSANSHSFTSQPHLIRFTILQERGEVYPVSPKLFQ